MYTARAASNHNSCLADMTLRLLTCDKTIATLYSAHDQSRTDRVDSLRGTAPGIASRPRGPGCPAARQIFGHRSTLTRDKSADLRRCWLLDTSLSVGDHTFLQLNRPFPCPGA